TRSKRDWSSDVCSSDLELGEAVRHFDTYLRHYRRSLTGPVEGMSALVEDVRRAGLRTVGLTNWAAETFHHAAEGAPVIGTITEESGRASCRAGMIGAEA